MYMFTYGRFYCHYWPNDTLIVRKEKFSVYTTHLDLAEVKWDLERHATDVQNAEKCWQEADSFWDDKSKLHRTYLSYQISLEDKKRAAARTWCSHDLKMARDPIFNVADPSHPSGLLQIKPLKEGQEKENIVEYINFVGLYSATHLHNEQFLAALQVANGDLETICQRRLACCMATHSRLGASSLLHTLSPDMLCHICEYVAFPAPHFPEAYPPPVETRQAGEPDPFPAAVQEVDMQPPHTIATLLRSAWDGLMSILGLKRRRH